MRQYKCTICYRLCDEDYVRIRKVPPFVTCLMCEDKRMKMRSMTPAQREADRAKRGYKTK